MSFLFTYLIVLAIAAVLAMASVRKFFLTNDAAGYVFVAINWALLIVATAVFVFLLKFVLSFFLSDVPT